MALPHFGDQWQLTMTISKCEKHGKKEEALAKIRDGADFGAVAREYSEDKARTGKSSS